MMGQAKILPAGVQIPLRQHTYTYYKHWKESFLMLPHRCLHCEGIVWGRGCRVIVYHYAGDDAYYAHRECRALEILSGKD